MEKSINNYNHNILYIQTKDGLDGLPLHFQIVDFVKVPKHVKDQYNVWQIEQQNFLIGSTTRLQRTQRVHDQNTKLNLQKKRNKQINKTIAI